MTIQPIAFAALGGLLGLRIRAAIFRHSGVDGRARSRCPTCQASVLDAGPSRLLAVLPATGRCPACHSRIGPLPFAVEIVTGIATGALAVRHDSLPQLLTLCWLTATGVALGFVDAAVHRLPDALTAPAGVGLLAVLGTAATVEHHLGPLARALLSGMLLFAVFLAPAFAAPAAIGLGDAKLAAVLGMALGWTGWATVLTGTAIAVMVAGLYGGGLLLTRRATTGDRIPLGPFLLVGALAASLLR